MLVNGSWSESALFCLEVYAFGNDPLPCCHFASGRAKATACLRVRFNGEVRSDAQIAMEVNAEVGQTEHPPVLQVPI